MDEKTCKVATPVFLREKLISFRVGQGANLSYQIQDPLIKQSVTLEPWQFYILEVLPGCETFSKLCSVFEDRFGHAVTEEEVESVFTYAADNKLFQSTSVSHPLLTAFKKKRDTQGKHIQDKPGKESEQVKKNQTGQSIPEVREAEEMPAGIQDATGMDANKKQGVKLFNPSWLFRLIRPVLSPLRHFIYIIPIILPIALFIAFNNSEQIQADLAVLQERIPLIEHLILSLLTVNLTSTIVIGLTAQVFRASVNAFCLVFYLGFIPRFMVRIGHVKQMSRRERIWLHAAPLLLRLSLFSLGIIFWYNFKTQGLLPKFALTVSLISFISFILTANPLITSNGYQLIAAYLNEPRLRGKSFRALFNKLRGTGYQQADNNVLAAYGLASFLFMIFFFCIVVLILSQFLKIFLGGASVFLVALISLFIAIRMVSKFKKIVESYERANQFERWKSLALPELEKEDADKKTPLAFGDYIVRTLVIFIGLLLFVPYNYEPGGRFVVLPDEQQVITSQVAGIIDEVHYDGGQVLEKGTVIGRLSSSEYESQIKIYEARIREQQSVIDELKSRPRPEEVALARQALEVEQRRVEFSKAKWKRMEELYKKKTISFEDLDDALREYEIDKAQVEEKKAALKLTQLGAPPGQIAAEEAKLDSWEAERDYYQQKIEDSYLHMPFSGKLITLHLRQKTGSYLERGQVFAMAENTSQVLVEIEIPEPDISYIEKSAKVRGRTFAFSDMEFEGVVTDIDSNVTQKTTGKVVKVITTLDNRERRLQSGMTGYAKVSSERLPVWNVMSIALVRFLQVEIWSWLP